ncbi:helix-turn-helix transcriptional regulator [Shewanella sp. 4t3-1-2LB]|uniref:helix-turn-helix domain-containing protein n=1 Tax=Shewanella sp. 4t3-1-2LB TaxID=2817682 RepID=UPI001A993E02|nr:helix-turn-helix transcriptional regulator [Shewanella sp. 4t3-1-2LB]MBO1273614.1 helix-turn-helix transcriptional regulator [Shewanella sp. 4t3-1-2LB]
MTSPLGQKINSRRKEMGISLERLADMAGISKSYLWELENRDKPNPSTEKIAQIAMALDVTTEFLLSSSLEADVDMDDQVFFRKYQKLNQKEKAKFRQLVDVWADDED